MQTARGVETFKQTMIKKHGSYENYRQHMREIASQGGKLGRTGGFASSKVGPDGMTGKERARVAGARGRAKSRRNKTAKTYKPVADRYEAKVLSFETPKRKGLLARFVGVK